MKSIKMRFDAMERLINQNKNDDVTDLSTPHFCQESAHHIPQSQATAMDCSSVSQARMYFPNTCHSISNVSITRAPSPDIFDYFNTRCDSPVSTPL